MKTTDNARKCKIFCIIGQFFLYCTRILLLSGKRGAYENRIYFYSFRSSRFRAALVLRRAVSFLIIVYPNLL